MTHRNGAATNVPGSKAAGVGSFLRRERESREGSSSSPPRVHRPEECLHRGAPKTARKAECGGGWGGGGGCRVYRGVRGVERSKRRIAGGAAEFKHHKEWYSGETIWCANRNKRRQTNNERPGRNAKSVVVCVHARQTTTEREPPVRTRETFSKSRRGDQTKSIERGRKCVVQRIPQQRQIPQENVGIALERVYRT